MAECVGAETVGMTASAAAALGAEALSETWPLAAGLGLVVAGGLVEGGALGWAQSTVLARRLPALRRRNYLLATLLVAGLGWAAASAPAALSTNGDEAGSAPPLALVLLVAAGLGLLMGPVLGGAQALALRRVARRPRRWVLANTLAGVVALGAATGAAAGTVLGLVTGQFLPEAA